MFVLATIKDTVKVKSQLAIWLTGDLKTAGIFRIFW